MSNNWRYEVVLNDAGPAAVVRAASLLGVHLADEGLGWIVSAIDTNGEEVSFTGSVPEAIEALGEGGGGYVGGLGDDGFDLTFNVATSTVGVSSATSLHAGDEAAESQLFDAFRWLCEVFRPRYGSSEDDDATENIWHQRRGDGWAGLAAVSRVERQDVLNGEVPDLIPWLTYFDLGCFPRALEELTALGGVAVEALGASGILVRLADRPWEGRFAVRSTQGYVVVDEFGRGIKGGRPKPIGLHRVRASR